MFGGEGKWLEYEGNLETFNTNSLSRKLSTGGIARVILVRLVTSLVQKIHKKSTNNNVLTKCDQETG